MTGSLPTAIAELEAEVMAIDARRPRLVTAIATLRELAGGASAAPRADVATVRTPKPKTTDRQTDRQSKARATPKARRSLPDDASSVTDRIIAAVREFGPIAPGALAQRLGFASSTALRHHMRALLTRGVIVETGKSSGLRFSLPLSPAAPAAPARTSASPSPVSSSSPLDVVKARDEAILAAIRRAPAKFDELLVIMPLAGIGLDTDSKRIALKQALRRLTIKGLIDDVGERFKARE